MASSNPKCMGHVKQDGYKYKWIMTLNDAMQFDIASPVFKDPIIMEEWELKLKVETPPYAEPLTPNKYKVTFRIQLKNERLVKGEVRIDFPNYGGLRRFIFNDEKNSTHFAYLLHEYIVANKFTDFVIDFTFINVNVRHSLENKFVGSNNIDDLKTSDVASDVEKLNFNDSSINISSQSKSKNFDHYSNLLNDQKFSDITIIAADKKTIYAHKCILALKSPILASMFSPGSNLYETESNFVTINDVNSEVLQEMLRFIYVGEIKDIKKIAAELLYAADKFQVEELKTVCIDWLGKNINADNAIGRFNLGDRYGDTKLRELAVNFIVKNLRDVVDKSEFQDLSVKNPIFFHVLRAISR